MATIRKRTWITKGATRTAWVVSDHRDGRRIRRQFPSRAAAEAFAAALERDIASGAARQSGARLTIAEIVSQWADEAERRAKAGEIEAVTAGAYQIHAGKIWAEPLAHIRADEARVHDFQRLADTFKAGLSIATARGRFTAIRMAMKWARAREIIDHDHASDVRLASPRAARASRGRVPGRAELARLVAAILPATETTAPDLAAAFFATALYTGARRSEILALELGDIDRGRGVITISKRLDRMGRLGPPKSRHAYRSIPIASTLDRVLGAWLEAKATPGALVFATRTGTPINPANLRHRAWVPLMRRAGLVDAAGRPLYRIHDLRHAAASVLIDQGIEAKMIQHMMGHSSVMVTLDIYGHLFADDVAAARIRTALEDGLTAPASQGAALPAAR